MATPRTNTRTYRFGRTELRIVRRQFRTAKNRRSTKQRQLIILLPGKTREVSLRLSKKPAPKRKVTPPRKSWVLVQLPLLLVFIGGVGIGVFATELTVQRSLDPIRQYAASVPAAKGGSAYVLPASQPTHVSIPSVGIDASVITVGQDSEGSIEMPPLFDWTTGWYKYSPTPGQLGPAIIVGHVDNYKGISVFWKLRDVQAGDKIYITRADGRTAKFEVIALKQFEQSAFPTKEVYGNIDYAGLRLITCGGSFNSQTASYTQNTVVYAKLVR